MNEQNWSEEWNNEWKEMNKGNWYVNEGIKEMNERQTDETYNWIRLRMNKITNEQTFE